ncbi:TrmH family RNA methyltransferase [Defluviitalea phaphyphila]|uniref:TrmH family RNA methyltransferase n=1 Tax=Defluviitalea phaphyphila TaxID=1473580 RepID=UPI0007315A8E|nr:RNA methyltransferase [Defluviitalea phaphyphila]
MIESIKNKKLKWLIMLQKSKKHRNKEKVFIVEGIKIIKEIPEKWEIISIFVSTSFMQENYNVINNISSNVFEVSDKVFNSLSDTKTPQGILAVCKQKTFCIDEILKEDKGFYIILENIQDPGNLGTIIRTGDALGAKGIFLTKGTVDLYNPKVIRSTMGSIFHLPILIDVDIDELLTKLNEKNIFTLSAHLKGEKYPYEYDLNRALALIIGNEANGIKDSTAKKTDALVKIPMLGKAESLNAAMASGILMYEIVRQRIK